MFLHFCIHVYVCLTCTLAANQVFALGLVRVNGSDSDVIQSVWVQVYEDVRRLLTTQNGLQEERQSLSLVKRKSTRQIITNSCFRYSASYTYYPEEYKICCFFNDCLVTMPNWVTF